MKPNEFIITLRNDYAFKRVFGSEENKSILQDFLECVLDIPKDHITGLELLNKEFHKNVLTDKMGILDIKLRLRNNTIIDIEIQNSFTPAFIPRTLFYWAKMYVENFAKGQPYTTLPKCITINLFGTKIPFEQDVHLCYYIGRNKTQKRLTNLLEIHFLDLQRAKERGTKDDKQLGVKKRRLINWLRFIETESKEERAMLGQTSEALAQANEVIKMMAMSERERQLYESRMKYEHDMATFKHTGFQEGVIQGEAQGFSDGVRQKALDTAIAFKRMGLSVEQISQGTGLTAEEVEKL